MPEGVELTDLSHGEESDDKPLVQITKTRAVVEEEDEAAPEAGDVPTVSDTESEEGEES